MVSKRQLFFASDASERSLMSAGKRGRFVMTSNDLKKHQQQIVVLALIFLLALGLRNWGITYGLPYSQITDESSDISTGLGIVSGQPPTYAYHRVTWSLMQLPVFGLQYFFHKLTDPAFSIAQYERLYYTQRGAFIYLARLLTTIVSAITILPVFAIGAIMTRHDVGGYLAAFLLAIHPQHVYMAHLALPDSAAAFCAAVAIWGGLLIMRDGSTWGYLLLGGGIALVGLTRLQGMILLVPLTAAHPIYWYFHKRLDWSFLLTKWLWALAAFVCVTVIANPFTILMPQAAFDDLRFIVTERYGGEIGNVDRVFDLTRRLNSIASNLRRPLTLLRPYYLLVVAPMIILAVRKRNGPALLVAFAGAFFSVFLLTADQPRETYWLPAVIPTAAVAAYLCWVAISHRLALGLLCLTIVAVPACYEASRIGHILAQPTTQTQAYDYAAASLPPDTRILIGENFIYSVPLARNQDSIQRYAQRRALPPSYAYQLDDPEITLQPSYDLFGVEYQDAITSDEEWWNFVSSHDIEVVIEADYCGGVKAYESSSDLDFPVITPETRSKLELTAVFSPFGIDDCVQVIDNRSHMVRMHLSDWQRVGPIIRIYRIPKT